MEFSTKAMKRMLKNNGSKRVATESAETLGQYLENYGSEIAEKAVQHANLDGRETVREVDVEKALKDFR